jgi:hypothetical protein
MDTVTLNHLAEAFVTVYGTEPDQQTPPGAARDEQHDVGGVPDDQPATGQLSISATFWRLAICLVWIRCRI